MRKEGDYLEKEIMQDTGSKKTSQTKDAMDGQHGRMDRNAVRRPIGLYSFLIHSGHFYSAPSRPLPLRVALDYSTDTVSEFHAEANRQLQAKDLSKVPT